MKKIAWILSGLLAASLHATTYYVDANGPSNGDGRSWRSAKRSLQAAVDLAMVAGDTVVVTNGTYAPVTVVDDRAITIRSVNGAASTFIDANNTNRCATLGYWAWMTEFVPQHNTVLEGFTLMRGNANAPGVTTGGSGGGAFCGTLKDCVLTGNTAEYGGGAAHAWLDDCTLKFNTAEYGGGADQCDLFGCTLSGNMADDGGGAYQCDLFGCTLTDNTAHNGGGGADQCDLFDCTLTGNTADEGGGADACWLDRCTLTGNGADYGGGAAYSTLYNCLLTGNTAEDGGGAYYSTLYNCTLTGNTADYGGGANYSTLFNSIIWGNTAFDYAPNHQGCTLYYSCTTPAPDPVYDHGGNITSPPLFISPGAGDYRLQAAPAKSPCIDTGYNAFVPWNYEAQWGSDLDGNIRIWGGTVDMGAYESGSRPSVATTIYADESRPDDDGDGYSWATAKKTLQAAVDIALVAGDTVVVTNGTYAPIHTDNRAITIRSVNGAAHTSIDGGDTNRCAILRHGSADSVLEGFTLKNGNANHANVTVLQYRGGGAFGGTLNNCTLSGNTANHGGGAYESMLNHCTLTSNTATYDGGGAYDSTFYDCVLTGNTANVGGGACDSTLNNCTLTGNTAANGGGAYDSTLNNCTLTGNSANVGGGARHSTLNNCTLSGNTADVVGGGAADGALYNCIIWGNTAPDGPNHSGSFLAFSCTTPAPGFAYDFGGNIEANPIFASPGAGNFRLRANSPCIDKGNNDFAVGDFDLDGNFRILGGTVDMGAYEWVAPAPPGTLYADIRRPDDSGDGLSWLTAKKTLQAAVSLASEGGAVLVAPGDYEPISRTDNAAITIRAVSGATRTCIDGGNTNRCATLAAWWNNGTATVLEGFTLKRGNGGEGGGAWGGTLNRCVLANNRAYSGGGAYGGILNRCTLTGNTATYDGGGAYDSTLTDCTLTGNGAWYGGGACDSTLTDCVLTGNEAEVGGGASESTLTGCFLAGNGAYWGGGAYAGTLTDCILTGNTAVTDYHGDGGDGGGACESDLANCELSGNTAEGSGGGAYDCTLYNCTLADNHAGGYGGGACEGTLDNCEVRGNTAEGVGGGSAFGTRANCLFTGNTAATGGGVYYGVTVNCTVAGNTATDTGGGTYMGVIANAIVWGNTAPDSPDYLGGTFTYSCAPGLPPSNGNIAANPLFVDAPAGDFHLQTAPTLSPCVNKGNNAAVVGLRDLDGARRVWDGTVDMGCYESGSPFGGTVFHVDWNKSDDSGDGLSWATAKSTLQGAADVATLLGDVVLVTNGTYAAVSVIGEPITIRSVNGKAHTFINGGGARRCAMLYHPADGSGSALVGFTLQNGAAGGGNGGGALGGFLLDCALDANHADYLGGGAAYCRLQDCTLTDNTVTVYGGGAAESVLLDCALTRNDSDHMGGGAYASHLVNCTLDRNTADYGGGAADCALTDCALTANEAQSYGGGFYSGGGDGFLLLHCTLSGNKALYGEGGGAYGKCQMFDCLIEGNTANGHGGGVHGTDTAKIANSRIIGNTAANNGGGAFRCHLQDCLVTGNEAMYGGGMGYGEAYNCTVAGNAAQRVGGVLGYALLANTIVWGNDAPADPDHDGLSAFLNSCAPGLPPTDGNIASDPLFVNPVGGDYRLQSGSPCIETGENHWAGQTRQNVAQFLDHVAGYLAELERNYSQMTALYPSLALPPVALLPRIARYHPGCDLDGNLRVWGDRVDMGCYEYGSVPPDGTDPGNGDLTLLITAIHVGDPLPSDPTLREITLDFAYTRDDGSSGGGSGGSGSGGGGGGSGSGGGGGSGGGSGGGGSGGTLSGVTILVRTWHDLTAPPVSLAPPATLHDHGAGSATLTLHL
ncbi:MAG: autotransporter adhesin family protein, partial [Kiritimatiellaeota bacterium]|nr:autotransporter adhesin family protein [Kiritimatiellota bacterium]